ncbi:protein phosphatase 2C domain-containing protein [Aquimarina litoralis]|uniref:protein phosphatase 2C domain-containing protein n=1 Tax=Aquimarina litoralis TaxID=584605 RepID=UPI001C57C23C|nr:protein phosphatase 2C domain-containing protein [Aquimarina litoralis]MBW1297501.1 SpoIIE family protein phosphatase [Aquimarina litoralis]
MKIYSTLKIGNFHTNYCEDFLVVEKISSDKFIVAVMDGCTMGKESVFASILIGKILRNIAKEEFYKEFLNKTSKKLAVLLQEILEKLFLQLKTTKNNLGLETEELLSTLIIGVVDEDTSNGEFLAIGDGLIYFDGDLLEFEQNDKPDYLGYHLHEDFNTWHSLQEQRLSIVGFKDLSMATDGIFSFKNFKNPKKQQTEKEVLDFLLRDQQGIDSTIFLEKKVRDLESKYDQVLTDDLAIIRVVS